MQRTEGYRLKALVAWGSLIWLPGDHWWFRRGLIFHIGGFGAWRHARLHWRETETETALSRATRRVDLGGRGYFQGGGESVFSRCPVWPLSSSHRVVGLVSRSCGDRSCQVTCACVCTWFMKINYENARETGHYHHGHHAAHALPAAARPRLTIAATPTAATVRRTASALGAWSLSRTDGVM